jgi:RNA polymerase sigma factor (sigma-70 family)
MRFAWFHADRYIVLYGEYCKKAGIEVDDLVQESYFALLDAVQAYDPKSGYKFLAFMKYPIKNRFNELVGFRTAKGRNDILSHSTSLDKPVDGTEDIILGDSIPDAGAKADMESVIEKDYRRRLHNDLQKCIEELPDEQQEVIKMRYFRENSFEEISLCTNKQHNVVRALKDKGIGKLRRDKRLKIYREEIMSRAYRGSFSSWLHTGTSSTEKAAMMLSDFEGFRKWEMKEEKEGCYITASI